MEARCVKLEFADPLAEGSEEIACVSCATAAVNVSDIERPLVSVAVTLRLREPAVAGAVPLKVSVVPLNFSQAGSAEPLDCDAVKASVSCCGSVKVLDARVKFTAWLVFQV